MNKQNAIAVIRATEENGGGTFYPFGGEPAKLSGGFMVGGLCKSLVFPWGEEDNAIVKRLQGFVKAAAPIFKNNPHAYLGTWVDSSTGLCHLDVSETQYSKYQAVVVGLSRGELAIWDNHNASEIDLLPYRRLLCEALAD